MGESSLPKDRQEDIRSSITSSEMLPEKLKTDEEELEIEEDLENGEEVDIEEQLGFEEELRNEAAQQEQRLNEL